MASCLRIFLLAATLLSGGVLQVVSAIDEDACCAGESSERGAPCSECPPGLACACCPVRAALEVSPTGAPPESAGVAVPVICAEPLVGPGVTEIFHPPRA